ncbi:MAG TPA: sensor histidine kinase, partial [Gaiellaceae bacterium]|nr:sensor histidine kinase [Gaiellaceae bacterium]
MSRIKSVGREYWFEILIALLATEAMVELVVGSPDSAHSLWFALPAIAVLVLPLFARRRFPFASLAAYWLLAAAITFIDWRPVPFATSLVVVGLTVAFLLGNLRDAVKATVGLVVIVVCMVILVYEIPAHSTALLVFLPLEFAIAWVAGFALRERSEQAEAAEMRAILAERERDAAARIAVAEERARIARELHDIVAHAVSVMVLQVGAVRHKLPDSEDRDALDGVERAGRTALTEMRRLLAAMRRDGDEAELLPQPGLDGLGSLLEEVGRAGLPVELHVDGEPVPLPRGIDLSAYRIVQEGLTNALKHAHATRADERIRYQPHALQLEVRDDGVGTATSDGLGHGLIGIRERVKIYGGEMTAESTNGGGFVLSTRLP